MLSAALSTKALDYAVALDNPRIHVMSGIPKADDDPVACAACLVENLAWASKLAGPEKITLLIEPLNATDMPGYFLKSADQAAESCARSLPPM